MSNMSYCRFHNTLTDLRDCVQAAEDFDTAKALFESLSDEEANAARRLLKLCRQFADDYDLEA